MTLRLETPRSPAVDVLAPLFTFDLGGETEPRLAAGAAVGPWRIVKFIAGGGSAQVYEVSRADGAAVARGGEALRDRAALKVLRTTRPTSEAVRRFRLEAESLAGVDHPGLVPVRDWGFADDGRPYLVMELVPGRTISAWIEQARPDAEQIVRVIASAAEAVGCALTHAGLVHRDLKPGNILIESGPGGEPRARVLDFGVARLIEARALDAPVSLVSEGGAVVGTLAYMAPEQLYAGTRPVDARADVYALGVVLYETLTGELPVRTDGLSHVEAARAKERRRVRAAAITRRAPGLPRGTPRTIALALSPEPEDRHEDPTALAADLRRTLQGHPPGHTRAPVLRCAARFASRDPALASAILALIVLLALSSVIVGGLAIRADRSRAQAETRFEDVRRLAKSLIFDLHDSIAELPGSTPARAQIVSRGLEYLDLLAGADGEDPELRLELAAGSLQIARVQAGAYWLGNLADLDGARASYDRAEALLDSLPPRLREQLSYREARADLLVGRNATTYGRDYRRLVAIMDECVRIRRALAQEDPGSAPRLAKLADALVIQGSNRFDAGDRESGLVDLREGARLARIGLSASPGDRALRIALAEAVYTEGYWRVRVLIEPAGADVPLRESNAIWEALLEETPISVPLRLRLVGYRKMLAVALAGQGDREGAMELIGQAMAACRELVALDPFNREPSVAVASAAKWAAEAHERLSAIEQRPVEQRLDDLRLARSWQLSYLETLTGLRERGLLTPDEGDYFGYVEAALARYDEAMARLGGEASPR